MSSKKEILEKIKKHLGLTKDVELADYLGVKRNVISNWKKRNSFDAELLYTKCDFLNPHVLLGGDGEIIKTKNTEKDTLLKGNKKSNILDDKQKIQKKLPFSPTKEEEILLSLLTNKMTHVLEKLFDIYKGETNEDIKALKSTITDLQKNNKALSIEKNIFSKTNADKESRINKLELVVGKLVLLNEDFYIEDDLENVESDNLKNKKLNKA